MSQQSTQPQTPRRETTAYGYPLYDGLVMQLEDRELQITQEQILPTMKALSFYLEKGNPEVKAFLMNVAMQHGIYTEDLFPIKPVVADELLAEADRCLSVEVQQ